MIDRLYEYVNGDPGPRRMRDRLSILAAFVCFLILTAAGNGQTATIWESVAILVVTQIATTWWFCRQATDQTEKQQDESAMRQARAGFRYGFAMAASVIVGLVVFLRPKLEAAAIGDRLQRLANDSKPTASNNARALLSEANARQLVLPTRPIERVVARRLRQADIIDSVLGNINRQAQERGIHLPVAGFIVWKTGDGQMFLSGAIAQLRHRDSTQSFEDGSFVSPDMVAFFAPLGSNETVPTRAGAAYIRVNGPAVTIPLDGMHLKNMIFVECTLLYTGAAIKIENSGFSNCTFQFADNLESQRLAEQLMVSPTVTFSKR